MANEALYQALAEALSKPSRAYRAAQAGLDIPQQALQGYLGGSEIADKFRQRKLGRQTLSEALGGQPLEAGIMNLTGETGAIQHPNLAILAALAKAKKETKNPRSQQANFLMGGKLLEYNPDTGYSPARVNGFSGDNKNPPEITPRVAPTIPTTESDKLADLNSMKEAVGVARKNFSPDFVGPVNARKLALAQTVNAPSLGLGATDKGALFTQSVQDLKDRLLRARSGAQINEQEYNRLVALVPDQYKSVPDFLAKLDRFNQVLDTTIGSKRQELMRAGYRGASTLPAGNNAPPPFGGAKIPTFNSPEEADASGYKGPAIIGGRKAVVH